MFGNRPTRRHAGLFGLALLAGMVLPSWVNAAWLGFKNDTNAVIVIQTSTVVNGQMRFGKPHKLYPGEVAWDPVATPGIRQIGVYDPNQIVNNKIKLVAQDTVNSQNADIFLSLQLVTPPAVKGQPPPQPALKLIPARAPVRPPGTLTAPPAPGKGTVPTPPPTPPGKGTTPPPPAKNPPSAKNPPTQPKGKVPR